MTRRQTAMLVFVFLMWGAVLVAWAVNIDDPAPPGPKVSDNPPVVGTTRYPLTINGDVWWCLTDQPPEQGELLRVTAETRLLDCLREVDVHG